MPYREVEDWGQTKPPVGTPLDAWPLQKYCVGYWLFAEGGGVSKDIISNTKCTFTSGGTNTLSWKPDMSGGPAVSYTNTSDGVNTNRLASFAWVASGSVAWRMTPKFVYNDSATHQFWGQTDAGNPEFSAQKFSDNNWYVGWVFGADRRIVIAASATNLTQGVSQDYVFVWGSAGSTLYRNGISIGTNGTAPSVSGATTTMMIGLENGAGGASGIGNGGAGSTISWIFFLNGYAMKQAEVQKLYQNPYGAFAAPGRRIISQVASVIATGTTPWPFQRGLRVI